MADAPSFFTQDEIERASAIVARCKGLGWMLATAESCTGGLVAALLTEVAGSSAVVDRGFVTYSNEAKMDLLGVSSDLLAAHGAVSRETAKAMADGSLRRSRATCAVAVTGVAGPGGGTPAKPVGLVHFGIAVTGKELVCVERRFGDLGRSAVRRAALHQALIMVEDALTAAERSAQATP